MQKKKKIYILYNIFGGEQKILGNHGRQFQPKYAQIYYADLCSKDPSKQFISSGYSDDFYNIVYFFFIYKYIIIKALDASSWMVQNDNVEGHHCILIYLGLLNY